MNRISDKKFDAIYNEYVKLVYFIVSKYVGDPFECENLTNDVFLGLYRSERSIKNIKYFLVSSARNEARSYLKKKKNFTVPLDEGVTEVYADITLQSDFRDTVEEMKNVLSEFEIEVVLSRAVFGETFKLIAKRHKRSLNTVYSVYTRAIKKYRKFLEEKGDE